jgi:hypothetical protein
MYCQFICVSKPEECDINYDKLGFLVRPDLHSKSKARREILVHEEFRKIYIKDVENFDALFKMDQNKRLKYKKMNLKPNQEIHVIDQNLPKSIYNFFVYKYNKLYHKVEIVCKVPNLITKEWSNIKFNTRSFADYCHHFTTWVEELCGCPYFYITDFKLESYRLIYHTFHINKILNWAINQKKIVEKKFKNLIIKTAIRFDLFEYLKYPFTRKLMKLDAYRELCCENFREMLLNSYKNKSRFS